MIEDNIKNIGMVLYLSDGLSTWVFSSYHSKIISDETVKDYIRLDGLIKKYLSKKINNSSSLILEIFESHLREIWMNIFISHVDIDISIPKDFTIIDDFKSRVSIFKNYSVYKEPYVK